jgi:hypothetical protein
MSPSIEGWFDLEDMSGQFRTFDSLGRTLRRSPA